MIMEPKQEKGPCALRQMASAQRMRCPVCLTPDPQVPWAIFLWPLPLQESPRSKILQPHDVTGVCCCVSPGPRQSRAGFPGFLGPGPAGACRPWDTVVLKASPCDFCPSPTALFRTGKTALLVFMPLPCWIQRSVLTILGQTWFLPHSLSVAALEADMWDNSGR